MAQNDYTQMASAFLTMWQEQMARSMTDRDFVQNMLRNMQQMQSQAGAAFGDKTYEPRQRQTDRHAADAPGAGELDELRRRLADCERRIARLERAAQRSAAKPAAKRTKPAAKKVAKKTSAGSQRRAGQPATSAATARTAKPAAKKATTKKTKAVKRAVRRTK